MSQARGPRPPQRQQIPSQRADVDATIKQAVVAGEEHLEMVQSFLDQFGEQAFRDAMGCGEMFEYLRQRSRFALQYTMQGVRMGLDMAMLVQIKADAANRGDKVSITPLGQGESHTITSTVASAPEQTRSA